MAAEMMNISTSENVMQKTCFDNFDTLACVRGALLAFLSSLAAIMCLGRVIQMHFAVGFKRHHHPLFYFCILQCAVSVYEFVNGWSGQSAIACMYSRCLQLLVLAHFYLSVLFRLYAVSPAVTWRCVTPTLCFFLGYFTAVLVLAVNGFQASVVDCYAYFFLMMACGEALFVQVVSTACFFILLRLSHVLADSELKRAQRRDLLIIVATLEVSVLAAMTYHTSLHFLSSVSDGGCSGIFHHEQSIYSSVKVPFEILWTFLPIWGFLFVFRLDDDDYHSEEAALSRSEFSPEGAIRDPSVPAPIMRRNLATATRRISMRNSYGRFAGYRPLGGVGTYPPPVVVVRRMGPNRNVLVAATNSRGRGSNRGGPRRTFQVMRRCVSLPDRALHCPQRQLSTIPEEDSREGTSPGTKGPSPGTLAGTLAGTSPPSRGEGGYRIVGSEGVNV